MLLHWGLLTMTAVWAVKEADFRTCEQTPFCQRLKSGNVVPLKLTTIKADGERLRFELEHGITGTISLANSILRVFMDEPGRDRFHYDAFAHKNELPWKAHKNQGFESGKYRMVTREDPFEIEVYYADKLTWTLKDLAMETEAMIKAGLIATKATAGNEDPEHDGEVEFDETEAAYPWSYTFNGHRDHVPKGPAALRMKVIMHGCEHVYGLPERATSFELKNTAEGYGGRSYRLYNLDVFEYAEDSPMGLYGSVPFVMGPKRHYTLGMLWNNPAETWVDVGEDADGKEASDNLFISRLRG